MSASRDRSQITLQDVTLAYGDRTVLAGVSLTVGPGEHVAVIGENGSGKSTLLRLMSGTEAPDAGEAVTRFPDGVGHLAQTLALAPHHTVRDAVDTALAELRELERRMREAEARLSGPPRRRPNSTPTESF